MPLDFLSNVRSQAQDSSSPQRLSHGHHVQNFRIRVTGRGFSGDHMDNRNRLSRRAHRTSDAHRIYAKPPVLEIPVQREVERPSRRRGERCKRALARRGAGDCVPPQVVGCDGVPGKGRTICGQDDTQRLQIGQPGVPPVHQGSPLFQVGEVDVAQGIHRKMCCVEPRVASPEPDENPLKTGIHDRHAAGLLLEHEHVSPGVEFDILHGTSQKP